MNNLQLMRGVSWMEEELLRLRMQQSYAEMDKNIRKSLYSDEVAAPLPKKTLAEKLSEWKWRISGAWDVLCGRADIC